MKAVAAKSSQATDSDVALLARVLASSGATIAPTSPERVDIASSGGPGSLSTLLAPLYAVALGATVSKIAVPGRPAGGLDVLGSLAGYTTRLDALNARSVLAAAGYVHVQAGDEFCPMDAQFFRWRQANEFQAVPALAIASLLAKKLAAGVGRVLLDLRVGPHGNMGTDREQARTNGRKFIAVAGELGIEAVCFIGESARPAQPHIGRGESLIALSQCLDTSGTVSLMEHSQTCVEMAELVTGKRSDRSSLGKASKHIHEDMLAAHGVHPDRYFQRIEELAAARRVPVGAG